MSVGWNHLLCFDCWNMREPNRHPVRVRDPEVSPCCQCKRPTRSGIFARGRAEDWPCKGTTGHLAEELEEERRMSAAYESRPEESPLPLGLSDFTSFDVSSGTDADTNTTPIPDTHAAHTSADFGGGDFGGGGASGSFDGGGSTEP
jgi:hypothetical protein